MPLPTMAMRFLSMTAGHAMSREIQKMNSDVENTRMRLASEACSTG